MGMLSGISRFFFQKTSNDFDANEALRRNRARYNALRALDPDVLVRHLSAFGRGDICGLERVIDEFETREDKMRIGSFKMAAAVSTKPWEVRIRKGEEENPRAKVHQERLTRFWNRAEATDAFCRNRKGGLRLLVKQMMSAQSRVYSVHDIAWRVNGDGTLGATFTHVPAWCFENRTGRLRYIRNDGQTDGEEMRDGEWLVTVGEGVGIPAAILAMAKRLSWNDWLLFSEKCGMPVIIGKTSAQRGTPAWDQLARAIRAVAPKTGLVADTGSDLSAVPMGAGSGAGTYRELVDTVDRAISALYRGGDLATVSGGPDAAGVNAQDGESELMDADGCAMVSETLRDQVEKFVIRFECGDFEPLAEIVINPPAGTEDVEREMEIDNHLAGLGVRLSKSDALARYGRAEAADAGDALTPPQRGFGGGMPPPLANERPETPLQTLADRLQNAPRGAGGQGEGEAPETLLGPFLRALKDDCKPLAAEVEELLKELEKGDARGSGTLAASKARALLDKIPGLAPEDPALAPLLAEEMAKAFGEAFTKARPPGAPDDAALANAGTSEGAKKGWETRRRNGWTPEQFADAERKVSSLIDDLAIKGPNGKGKGWKNREESFGALDAGTVADIKRANPAMDVEASEAIVDTAQLHHAMDHHGPGKEKNPNQIPITNEDLKKLPDVLSDYDSIVAGKGKADGKQTEAVVFRKKYPDGTIACVELDLYSEKRKGRVLKFQTMWKEKVGEQPSYSDGAALKAPRPLTPETE